MLSTEDLVNNLPQDLVIRSYSGEMFTITNTNGHVVMEMFKKTYTIIFYVIDETISNVIDCIRRYKLCDFTYDVVAETDCVELEYLRPNNLSITANVDIRVPMHCIRYYNHINTCTEHVVELHKYLRVHAGVEYMTELFKLDYGKYYRIVVSIRNGNIPIEVLIELSIVFSDKCFIHGQLMALNGESITGAQSSKYLLEYCKRNYSVNALISNHQPLKSARLVNII